jgi:hypothetical protein
MILPHYDPHHLYLIKWTSKLGPLIDSADPYYAYAHAPEASFVVFHPIFGLGLMSTPPRCQTVSLLCTCPSSRVYHRYVDATPLHFLMSIARTLSKTIPQEGVRRRSATIVRSEPTLVGIDARGKWGLLCTEENSPRPARTV